MVEIVLMAEQALMVAKLLKLPLPRTVMPTGISVPISACPDGPAGGDGAEIG